MTGRFASVTVKGERGDYAVAVCGDFAKSLKPKEGVRTRKIESIVLRMCADMSYNKACSYINELTHKDNGLKKNTECEHVTSVGRRMFQEVEQNTADVLVEHGFNPETGLPEPGSMPSSCAVVPPVIPPSRVPEERWEYIERYNARVAKSRDHRFMIKDTAKILAVEESAENQVLCSLDGVLHPHQKEKRSRGSKRDVERVELQVGHVSTGGKCRVLMSNSLKGLFLQVIALMLHHGLLDGRRLLFITDGAKCLRKGIHDFFPYRLDKVVILDWFHLIKRIMELVSMTFKGTKEAKLAIRNNLARMLWVGNVGDAIRYVEDFPEERIKNVKKRDELVNYLKDRDSQIPCYALRKRFGLPISSTAVEKANDEVVSIREKGRGMSFTRHGGCELAQVRVCMINGEIDSWLKTGKLGWEMHDFVQKAA